MITKSDYDNDFKDVSFYYFPIEEMYDYKLKDLSDDTIEKLKEYVSDLENSPDYFTYYRGNDFDIKQTFECFNYYKTQQLGKFFVVGEKGKDYFNNSKAIKNYDYSHDDVSKYVQDIFKNEKIFKEIVDDYLPKAPKYRNEKILGLVHITEEYVSKHLKNQSSYISVAVGDGNYKIAERFSLKCYKNKYGFIIMGFEKESGDTLDSSFFKGIFKKESNIGNAYNDIIDSEQEILVREVLWPQKIIGVYAINYEKKSVDFIVNPWLVSKIEKGKYIDDFEIGIDQSDFDKFYKELGYKNFIEKKGESTEIFYHTDNS